MKQATPKYAFRSYTLSVSLLCNARTGTPAARTLAKSQLYAISPSFKIHSTFRQEKYLGRFPIPKTTKHGFRDWYSPHIHQLLLGFVALLRVLGLLAKNGSQTLGLSAKGTHQLLPKFLLSVVIMNPGEHIMLSP